MPAVYRYPRLRVFGRAETPLVIQRVGRQTAYRAHEHDFIEIVLAAGGTAIQETATRRLPLRPGTVTVLRPGHWHAYRQCRNLVIYNCCFGPELLRRELSWLMDDPRLADLLWGAGGGASDGPPILQLAPAAVRRLRRILDEGLRDQGASTRVARLCLFLTSMADAMPAPEVLPAIPPSVRTSIRLLETDLAREWTISELAAEARCSPEHLIRLFRKAIGLSPYAYLSRCRAERAAALLLQSPAPIAEIAQRVGWSEPCHFARRFRRHYGLTASEFRARGQTP